MPAVYCQSYACGRSLFDIKLLDVVAAVQCAPTCMKVGLSRCRRVLEMKMSRRLGEGFVFVYNSISSQTGKGGPHFLKLFKEEI